MGKLSEFFKDNPVAAVDLDNTLVHFESHTYHPHRLGELLPNAAWGLQVLKHNDYEIVLHTNRAEEKFLREWADRELPGLVDYINHHPRNVVYNLSTKPAADVFIDDRDLFHLGQNVCWLAVIRRLYEAGYLPVGIPEWPVGENKA